jgi:hypothetical protein
MPELTASTPTLDDAPPVVHARACSTCGAPIEDFDRFCTACGTPQAPPASAQPPATAAPLKYIRCETCGAEVGCHPDQRSYVCPFCDSTYVVEFAPDATNRQPPEFVIGFAVTPEKAQEAFHHWIGRNGLFRPGDLKSAQIDEKLKGVYLPFWSFSMLGRSRWSAQIGEYWYRTETYTTVENGKTVTKTRQVRETEWWPLAGRHHEFYSGYLVSGSRGLPQQEAERIKPFHLAAFKRYEPFFLAGWLNEEYSVERDAALAVCQQEFTRRAQADVAAFMPGDTHSGLNVVTEFTDVNSDLVLLPIYLLSYKYRGKLYRFLLNGQTGKTAGDKPLSWPRILAAIGIGILLFAIIVLVVALLQR